MNRDDELLEKVAIFLVILVSAILLFTQYQFYKITSSAMAYFAGFLILALIGFIVWYFLQKPETYVHHAAHNVFHDEQSPLTFMEKSSYVIVALVAILIIFNQMQLSQVSALAGVQSGLTFKSSSIKTPVALTGDPEQDAISIVISTGTPFYGENLGVSFDDPIRSLETIAQMDPSYGRNKVQLSGEDVQRYIKILTIPSMGCQYCCGADTSVTNDGRPTCGCKHSWAMRGLAAYLIQNYPDISDEEIMTELARWKGLFFPKQMVAKYLQQSQSGHYTPDIAGLLANVDESKLADLKSSVAVSGNAQSSDGISALDELPSMVGGC